MKRFTLMLLIVVLFLVGCQQDGSLPVIRFQTASETPVVETPVVETPVVETPVVETPVVETPVVEAPVVETPVVEAPVVETSVLEIGCDGADSVFSSSLDGPGPASANLPPAAVILLSMDPGSVTISTTRTITSNKGMLLAIVNLTEKPQTIQVQTGFNGNNARVNVHACIFMGPPLEILEKAWEWQGLPGSASGEKKPVFKFYVIELRPETHRTAVVGYTDIVREVSPTWPPSLTSDES